MPRRCANAKVTCRGRPAGWELPLRDPVGLAVPRTRMAPHVRESAARPSSRVLPSCAVLPANLARALDWYAAAEPPPADVDVCMSRDVFQARLDTMLRTLLRTGWAIDEASLLAAVLGELGNNSFDHNLGRWPDVPGCRLGQAVDHDPPLFWIVDRGVGVLETLRHADPSLASPQQALDAAFARVLSGRAPERRGNGLKFVRDRINGGSTRALVCRSGGATVELGHLRSALAETRDRLDAVIAAGVAAVIAWRLGQ